eukprot:13302495-Alexandrium_andersonii.AAC.1
MGACACAWAAASHAMRGQTTCEAPPWSGASKFGNNLRVASCAAWWSAPVALYARRSGRCPLPLRRALW